MDLCEFCQEAEAPSYPLKLTLAGKGWRPLERVVHICGECIDALFFPNPELSGKPVPIDFLNS